MEMKLNLKEIRSEKKTKGGMHPLMQYIKIILPALIIFLTASVCWSKSSSGSSFKFIREGEYGIYMPSNFRYVGVSEYDLGEKEFTDGTAYIYLTSDCMGGIPLSTFDYYLSDQLEAASKTLSINKSTYKVASGYTAYGWIYYCKMAKVNGCVYLAAIMYPPSKRSRYDHKLAKMFNTFPVSH